MTSLVAKMTSLVGEATLVAAHMAGLARSGVVVQHSCLLAVAMLPMLASSSYITTAKMTSSLVGQAACGVVGHLHTVRVGDRSPVLIKLRRMLVLLLLLMMLLLLLLLLLLLMLLLLLLLMLLTSKDTWHRLLHLPLLFQVRRVTRAQPILKNSE